MSDRDGSSFLWFLAGLGVGAVVGVLYAPRSGSEMRESLRSKADEGREFVRELSDALFGPPRVGSSCGSGLARHASRRRI